MDRRQLFGGLGAAAVAGLLVGCQSDSSTSASGGPKLRWWDHISGNDGLVDSMFKDFTAETGMPVEYTYQQSTKLGQSLQLAKQSNELPDVHTNVGLDLPLQQLVDGGWFQPLQLPDEFERMIPEDDRVEGINVIDGKLYSFPASGSRFYNGNMWHNREILTKAGVEPPTTYDEMLQACRKVKEVDPQIKGFILNSGGTFNRAADDMVQASGFEGMSGQLFATGEIRWHDDHYVEMLEFMMALHRDKHVVQGQFNSDTARPRFMIGQAAFLLDGMWTVASVKTEGEQFLDKLGVSGPLTATGTPDPITYRPRVLGEYYVSAQSEHPAEASALLGRMLTPEFAVWSARRMFQMPRDTSGLDDPEVVPVFADQLRRAQDHVFATPQLARRDPELARSMSKVPATKPDLVTLLQGLIAGELTDIRGELKKMSDTANANRDKVLKENNLDVSDLAFPNWKPGQDYTAEMYES